MDGSDLRTRSRRTDLVATRLFTGGQACYLILNNISPIIGEIGKPIENKSNAEDVTNNAKARFGELLDQARREPVTIEKHGRPVAVMLSIEDYEELEALKLSRLRAEVDIGVQALAAGDLVEVDSFGLKALVEDIKKTGRNTISR